MSNVPSALSYGYAQTRPLKAGVPLVLLACVILAKQIGGAVKQVSTLTVDSASDADYTFQLRPSGGDAITVTYNEGATGTTTTKATGIKNLINSRSDLAGFVIATSSTNVVTITALRAGEGFTLSDSDAKLTSAASVANAAAGDLEFGCAAVLNASDYSQVQAPDEANAVARVATLTPASATNNESVFVQIIGDINRDGVEETYSWVMPPDGSASVGRICDFLHHAIEAEISTSPIDVTESGTVVTLTGSKGVPFSVRAWTAPALGSDAAPTSSVAVAYSTSGTQLQFAGVALAADVPENISGSAKWRGTTKSAVPIMAQGIVPVRLDDDVTTIVPSDPVGYRVNDDGASEVNGSFRNAASGTDVYILPSTRARWVDGVIHTDIDGHRVSLLQLL